MTRLRQTIARRLKDVQNTAAMLTTFNKVDMSHIMAMRAQYKDVFEKKHGSKLGFIGFFTKACVQAPKEISAANPDGIIILLDQGGACELGDGGRKVLLRLDARLRDK